MTRRNPPAKWVLPGTVNPAGRRCFTIQVPDEEQHIAAFRGAMLDLASGYKWADDPTHKAREVALVWRDVIEQMEDCVQILLRPNPLDDCELQISYDNGATWETRFNAYSCATRAIIDQFGPDSSQPGSRSQPGEQPGGAAPAPAQCFDLDLTVNANSMLLIPLALASGWTLTFTQVKGAWNDGNIGHDWVCPTGHAFFLGTCSALVEGTDAADPIPTSPHMLFIMRLADGTYVAPPIDGTAYVIPASQPAGNYFLLANDSVLSDNQGSVALHLLACNTGWCYHFDFSLNNQSFVAYNCAGDCGDSCNSGPAGVYGSARWNNTTYACSGQNVMYIYRDIGGTEQISQVRVKGHTDVAIPDGGLGSALEVRLYNGGTLAATQRIGVSAGDIDHTFVFTPTNATRIWITLSSYNLHGSQTVTDAFVYGTDATNPFGSNNC